MHTAIVETLKLEAELEVREAGGLCVHRLTSVFLRCSLGRLLHTVTAAPRSRLQNKAYSRDWLVRGRVRVTLKREDGTPVNAAIPTRERRRRQGARGRVSARGCCALPSLPKRTWHLTAPPPPCHNAGRALLIKLAELVPSHPPPVLLAVIPGGGSSAGAGSSKQAAQQPAKKAGGKKKK